VSLCGGGVGRRAPVGRPPIVGLREVDLLLLPIVRWTTLVCTGVTLGATVAHVLELPNKFTLDGPLWLAVQQNLYCGWGAFVGPFETTAIVSTWLLLWLVRRRRPTFLLTLIAALCLSAALAVFFALNAPVNAAFAGWTAATLPRDWPTYRLRWELGHAASFVLVLVAFIALLRGLFADAVVKASRSGENGST
jgi:hypothetical protein